MTRVRVTTGTGDDGYTGLMGPGRVAKHDARIEAIGAVDEATSALGCARAQAADQRVRDVVVDLQHGLYLLMAELATSDPEAPARMTAEHVTALERAQASLRDEVEIPAAFVVPGATASSAAIDLARAIVRRAERRATRLLHDRVIQNRELVRYLNRASDLLHVLARYDEVKQGVGPQIQSPPASGGRRRR